MDSINAIFMSNRYVSYPSNYSAKQRTVLSLAGKEVFKTENCEADKEINKYLDILYKDTDKNLLKQSDKLVMRNLYTPIKTQKIKYGGFYI